MGWTRTGTGTRTRTNTQKPCTGQGGDPLVGVTLGSTGWGHAGSVGEGEGEDDDHDYYCNVGVVNP